MECLLLETREGGPDASQFSILGLKRSSNPVSQPEHNGSILAGHDLPKMRSHIIHDSHSDRFFPWFGLEFLLVLEGLVPDKPFKTGLS